MSDFFYRGLFKFRSKCKLDVDWPKYVSMSSMSYPKTSDLILLSKFFDVWQDFLFVCIHTNKSVDIIVILLSSRTGQGEKLPEKLLWTPVLIWKATSDRISEIWLITEVSR